MANNQRLVTDDDFIKAMNKETRIRVFQDDHMIHSDGIIVRFTEDMIVVQSSVSDLAYHQRTTCEFFEMKSR